MDLDQLTAVAARLTQVPGVVAVALGGSRARGTHRPDSDIDLGLYYRGDLDVTALRELAGRADITEPGGWGPWVNGGGWLTEGEWRVDWIYRDLDRVHTVWDDCRAGRYEVGAQAGHPLGFYSHAYAGEVAFCRVLSDPTGELTALKTATAGYPAPLREALLDGLWEAGFMTANAAYGVKGDDPVYAAGCLFRAIGVLCHALHGHAGKWLVNEKGMVASADALGLVPGFGERAGAVLAGLGDIAGAVAAAEALAGDVRAAVGR
ncbi:nucleotidyltransferase [Actinorhabdospora filicis]|uniref:Nucleotidyltransferase n=1 Tax=Actinorhabdospora filicis TaxID=1785913 RepID=A0A9W6SN11_9ACTN|nr:nucleotidyltransferase domain-containing protein [Actinorhabdospora filicis]GLZ78973.1 nucleotidyltransferase [Actinorhabdospora filicis]